MHALNFSTKAIEDLLSFPCPDAPGTAAGLRYIVGKLREAEVFMLQDGGDLLDRSKPRPQVPGLLFKPPFPVVALEFPANTQEWGSSPYTVAKCSRRISLAWEWSDDLPDELKAWAPQIDRPGVIIASIACYDEQRIWMAVPLGAYVPFDGQYIEPDTSEFRDTMLAEGRINLAQANAPAYEIKPFPLLPDAIAAVAGQHGIDRMFDFMRADLMDEVNAYCDLCFMLACRNVEIDRHPASAPLNKARIKAGRIPLKDFHVLMLKGEQSEAGTAIGSRSGPRTHLRRGHIRRLSQTRITWVNAALVRGRGGAVSKSYAVKGSS